MREIGGSSMPVEDLAQLRRLQLRRLKLRRWVAARAYGIDAARQAQLLQDAVGIGLIDLL